MDPLADNALVYRIQDAEGRGPFRPGFSSTWLDAARHCEFPSWLEEFGWCIPADLQAQGWHFGSACRSVEGIKQWFSRTERRRLERFGYSLVALKPDRILAESERQLVIARRLPLADGAIIAARAA
jgi:hypothetical protein